MHIINILSHNIIFEHKDGQKLCVQSDQYSVFQKRRERTFQLFLYCFVSDHPICKYNINCNC